MIWTAAIVFVLDQITKVLVVQVMNLKSVGVINVFEPFLVFRMAWNAGINFGLGAGMGDFMRWVLIALALGICVAVVIWVRREGGGRAAEISAGLLVGGAIANVIDRVIYGAVADFLNMSCCGLVNPFSFNVADISIFAGAALLILRSGDPKPDPA